VAKRAAIMVARYTHAHQFKRTRRELKFLRTRLGRVIRDIRVRSPATTASSNASRSFSLWPIGYASSITASARGLCATRPRGRMHRQEQGADGVRVRLRSIGRHPGHQRRPVCLHAKALYGNGSAATRWDRSSPSLSSRPALRPAVSMSTSVIAATITNRSSASGSAARYGAAPNPLAARCGGEPPSKPSSATLRPSTVWASGGARRRSDQCRARGCRVYSRHLLRWLARCFALSTPGALHTSRGHPTTLKPPHDGSSHTP